MITFGFPIGIPITACAAGPGAGFIIDQFTLPIPQGAPLHTGRHVIITESAIDFNDGVFKFGRRVDWLQIFVQLARKLDETEHCLWIGCDRCFKFIQKV